MATADDTGGARSQTLSRGIRLLELLAASERPLSIDELAHGLGVHRSIAYRLLRTLEDHGLVARDAAGLVVLAAGMAALAAGVSRDLQQAALPELDDVADELGMTCLVAVLAESDEAVTLVSATPRRSAAVVTYRPGHRHPITLGGPGKAILIGLSEADWPEIDAALRDDLDRSRARGYATSDGEVVPSLRSVAVPLRVAGQPPASLAVIHVALPRPEAEIAEILARAAERIVRAAAGA